MGMLPFGLRSWPGRKYGSNRGGMRMMSIMNAPGGVSSYANARAPLQLGVHRSPVLVVRKPAWCLGDGSSVHCNTHSKQLGFPATTNTVPVGVMLHVADTSPKEREHLGTQKHINRCLYNQYLASSASNASSRLCVPYSQSFQQVVLL